MRKSVTMIGGLTLSAVLLVPALAHGAASSNISLAAIGLAGVVLGQLAGRKPRIA